MARNELAFQHNTHYPGVSRSNQLHSDPRSLLARPVASPVYSGPRIRSREEGEVTPGLTSSSIGTQSTSSSTFTLPSALVSDALDIIVIGIAVPISSGSNSVSSVSD